MFIQMPHAHFCIAYFAHLRLLIWFSALGCWCIEGSLCSHSGCFDQLMGTFLFQLLSNAKKSLTLSAVVNCKAATIDYLMILLRCFVFVLAVQSNKRAQIEEQLMCVHCLAGEHLAPRCTMGRGHIGGGGVLLGNLGSCHPRGCYHLLKCCCRPIDALVWGAQRVWGAHLASRFPRPQSNPASVGCAGKTRPIPGGHE